MSTSPSDQMLQRRFRHLREIEAGQAPSLERSPVNRAAIEPQRRSAALPFALAASLVVAMTSVMVLQNSPDDNAVIAEYEARVGEELFVMDSFMVACDCILPSDTPVPGTFEPFDSEPPNTLILNSL